MHVWIVADVPATFPGGMRRHMELHAEGLRRLGHRSTIWWGDSFPSGPGSPIFRRLPGWRSLAALLGEYRDQRPDIINLHTDCAPAWIAARAMGLITAKLVAMSYAGPDAAVQVHRPRDALRRPPLACGGGHFAGRRPPIRREQQKLPPTPPTHHPDLGSYIVYARYIVILTRLPPPGNVRQAEIGEGCLSQPLGWANQWTIQSRSVGYRCEAPGPMSTRYRQNRGTRSAFI